MEEQVHNTLGKHDADIAVLKAEVAGLRTDIKQVLAILNEAKGGWKTVALIAGVSSTATVVLGKFFMSIAAWAPR